MRRRRRPAGARGIRDRVDELRASGQPGVTSCSAPRFRCRWTGTTRTASRSSWPSSATWPVDPRSGSGRCSSTRADRARAASTLVADLGRRLRRLGWGPLRRGGLGSPGHERQLTGGVLHQRPQPGTGSGPGVSIPLTPAESRAYQRKTVELARRCGEVNGDLLSTSPPRTPPATSTRCARPSGTACSPTSACPTDR